MNGAPDVVVDLMYGHPADMREALRLFKSPNQIVIASEN
jgi:hypothetical protein